MSRARLSAAALLLTLLAAASARSAAPAAERLHVVMRGDTLTGLASRYGVTVQALVTANHFASDRVTLRIGQRVKVPPSDASAPRAGRILPGAASNLRAARGPLDLVLTIPAFIEEAPQFVWPSYGPITSPFGRRRLGWHHGVDIRGRRGDPVTAAAAGVVIASNVEPRYGRVVKIQHKLAFITVYAHNDHNLVEVGDEVQAGDLIGRMGRTGRATADHVHFEIRRDGRVYNPLYLLPLPPQVGRVDDVEPDESDE